MSQTENKFPPLKPIGENKSIFKTLYEIDVTPYVEHYGNVDYMEWSVAWKLVREHFPNASFEIFTNKEDLPYFETPYGMFVKTAVHIEGRTELDWYDVETGTPTAATIAKAHQRALVKCLGRHGLGLKLWEKKGREGLKGGASKTGSDSPQNPPKPPAQTTSAGFGPPISEPQAKRFYAIYKKAGWDEDQAQALLGSFGYQNSLQIKKSDYEKICDLAQAGPLAFKQSLASPSVHAPVEEVPPFKDEDLPF